MSPAKLFYTNDIPTLIAIAKDNPFGDLVTVGDNGPLTTAIPLLITCDDDGVLVQGHLTRTNPQWRQSRLDLDTIAIFRAEHSYVSPRWYRTSIDNQHHVPTWNYSRVEAVGTLEFFTDASELLTLVTTLTATFEPPKPTGWSPDRSPEDYIGAQLRAIVGFNLRVKELRGIRKLSQNKPLEDRQAVIASLNQLGQATLASTMQSLLEVTSD
jgi:transcriptional regulator